MSSNWTIHFKDGRLDGTQATRDDATPAILRVSGALVDDSAAMREQAPPDGRVIRYLRYAIDSAQRQAWYVHDARFELGPMPRAQAYTVSSSLFGRLLDPAGRPDPAWVLLFDAVCQRPRDGKVATGHLKIFEVDGTYAAVATTTGRVTIVLAIADSWAEAEHAARGLWRGGAWAARLDVWPAFVAEHATTVPGELLTSRGRLLDGFATLPTRLVGFEPGKPELNTTDEFSVVIQRTGRGPFVLAAGDPDTVVRDGRRHAAQLHDVLHGLFSPWAF